jgi:hypothetical protein
MIEFMLKHTGTGAFLIPFGVPDKQTIEGLAAIAGAKYGSRYVQIEVFRDGARDRALEATLLGQAAAAEPETHPAESGMLGKVPVPVVARRRDESRIADRETGKILG